MRKSVCRETTIQNEQFLKEIDGNIILVQTRLHLVYWSTPGVYIFIMIYGDLGKYMKNWTSKSFSVSFILVYLLIKIIYFSNSAKKVLKTILLYDFQKRVGGMIYQENIHTWSHYKASTCLRYFKYPSIFKVTVVVILCDQPFKEGHVLYSKSFLLIKNVEDLSILTMTSVYFCQFPLKCF